MTKLDKSQWDSYLAWLEDYEYKKLELPVPDKVIFLDMPIEISQRLMSERYSGDESKKDIHESNTDFLYKCREAALYTAERQNWEIVSCSKDGQPIPINEINDILFSLLKEGSK
jgi:dTMP kinase